MTIQKVEQTARGLAGQTTRASLGGAAMAGVKEIDLSGLSADELAALAEE